MSIFGNHQEIEMIEPVKYNITCNIVYDMEQLFKKVNS